MSNSKIDLSLILTIGNQKITLTHTEAEHLHSILDKLFGKPEKTSPFFPLGVRDIEQPKKWDYPQPPLVWYCNGNSKESLDKLQTYCASISDSNMKVEVK